MSMQVIGHIEVGAGGSSTIEFSSIPIDGTYTDLLLAASLRDTTGIGTFMLQSTFAYFNNDNTSTTFRTLEARNIGVVSASSTNRLAYHAAPPAPANTFSSMQLYIPNFATTAYKSYSLEYVIPSNSSTGDNTYRALYSGLWSQTSKITTIRLQTTQTFVQYSSATLYGITAGSDGTTTVS